jgi:hypothetical protein
MPGLFLFTDGKRTAIPGAPPPGYCLMQPRTGTRRTEGYSKFRSGKATTRERLNR